MRAFELLLSFPRVQTKVNQMTFFSLWYQSPSTLPLDKNLIYFLFVLFYRNTASTHSALFDDSTHTYLQKSLLKDNPLPHWLTLFIYWCPNYLTCLSDKLFHILNFIGPFTNFISFIIVIKPHNSYIHNYTNAHIQIYTHSGMNQIQNICRLDKCTTTTKLYLQPS